MAGLRLLPGPHLPRSRAGLDGACSWLPAGTWRKSTNESDEKGLPSGQKAACAKAGIVKGPGVLQWEEMEEAGTTGEASPVSQGQADGEGGKDAEKRLGILRLWRLTGHEL